MKDLFGFSWPVAEDGYRWVETQPILKDGWEWIKPRIDTEADGQWFITDGIPHPQRLTQQKYYPLRHNLALFREFAATKANQDGFLEFANKYGLLGGEQTPIPVPLSKDSSDGKYTLGYGEPWQFWENEHRQISKAVQLIEMLQQSNIDGLSKLFHWKEPGIVVYRDEKEIDMIARGSLSQEFINNLVPGDVVKPAQFYVQRLVNRGLRGRVSPQLIWTSDLSRLEFFVVPSSLIGAMWLQIARSFDENRSYRQCEECSTWFEISSEGSRASRVFCSDACRARAYRKRKAKAQRLYEEGMSVEAIAEKLGSDPATVQGWLDRGK